jgi:tetratricopeptide (TPR) repeat protein
MLSIETIRFAQAMFENQLRGYKPPLLKRYLAPYLWNYFRVRSVKHSLAYCFWSLGLVYRERGMHSAALQQFETSVSISTELRDKDSVARYSLELCKEYIWHGEPERALATIELGLRQRVRGFEPLFAWQLCYLGNYYVRCSRLDDAETVLSRALAMRMSPLGRPYALYLLGKVHLAQGSRQKAVEYLEQSLELYRLVDSGGNILMCEKLLHQAAADPEPQATS